MEKGVRKDDRKKGNPAECGVNMTRCHVPEKRHGRKRGEVFDSKGTVERVRDQGMHTDRT